MDKKPPSGPGKNPFSSGGSGLGGSPSSVNPYARSGNSSGGSVRSASAGLGAMGSAPLKNPYEGRGAPAKTPNASPAEKTSERMTGDNYQRLYLQRREAEQAEQNKKAQAGTQNNSQAAQLLQMQKAQEDRLANVSRARARDLQGQISALKSQLGQAPDADNHVNSLIQSLMNELGGIPGKYH